MTEDSEDILRDIRRWLKIMGLQEAKPLLTDALTHEDDQRQRDLRTTYHLTNGENSRKQIAKYISFSRGWVGDRHDEWSNMGLIEKGGSNSSYKHLIGLEEAGIEIPDITEPEEESDSDVDEDASNGDGENQ